MTHFSDWLSTPEHKIAPSDMGKFWAVQYIEFVVKRPKQHAASMILLNRIRRAWGHELRKAASETGYDAQVCTWEPPCARDIFFREQFRFNARHGLPKPFALSIDLARSTMVIRLALFGAAIDYVYAARETMATALRFGVDWQDGPESRSDRPKLALMDCRISTPKLPFESVPDLATLSFVTPMRVTTDLRSDPSSIIAGLARRTGNLLIWMDAMLEVEWESLSSCWKKLEYSIEQNEELSVPQVSRRQGKKYEANAAALRISISGNITPIWPFLVAGTSSHAGSGATYGFGRYNLLIPERKNRIRSNSV